MLDLLVTSNEPSVPVRVSEPARSGLEKLRNALELRDIGSLVLPSSTDILSEPPPGLTDPEDLKYFNLYRESFTLEQFHVPKSQRGPNSKPQCAPLLASTAHRPAPGAANGKRGPGSTRLRYQHRTPENCSTANVWRTTACVSPMHSSSETISLSGLLARLPLLTGCHT